MPNYLPEKLARIIRSKLADGTLPREDARSVAASNGTGETCAACDQTIASSQIELKVQYRNHPTVRFHIGCYRVWEAERQRETSG